MRENNYQQKNFKRAIIVLASFCFIALAFLILCDNVVLANEEKANSRIDIPQDASRGPYIPSGYFENTNTVNEISQHSETEAYKFLSNLNYITENNWSYVGWGSIKKDMPPEGSTITLKIDGKDKIFLKGLGIHANAQLTYDISELSGNYTRFVTKAGIDASRGSNGNGVWFQISVSNDGSSWTQLYKSGVVKGTDNALDIDVNIAGYKYLRIYVNHNGSNAADHAVLGGAKLVKSDYSEQAATYNKIHTLEYYDNILESKDIDYNYENNFRLILEREFVRKIGYDAIVELANLDSTYRETLDWLLSSNYNLEQVIEVGEISSGVAFIKNLTNIYTPYKSELTKENGDVYTKMMIATSAAYTTDRISSAMTFSHYSPNYDYVERFGIIKSLYDEGLFLYGNGLKTLHIDLFRSIMQDGARNDELRWFNYRGKQKNYSVSAYGYDMGYVQPVYNKPELWAEENRQKYDTKYHLTENGVPYGDGILRYWMAQEKGGICWNLSRNVAAAIKMMGRPSIGCYQPGHEAALYYIAENDDGTGKGSWGIANNIFGWGKSSTKWYGGNRFRTIFDWANKSFANQIENGSNHGNSAAYTYLAQANLNRYEDYKKSLYINLIANSYSDHNDKITAYNKALEVCEINLDSYDYKIKSYKALNKTSAEWHKLANDIIDNYTYYPMAMNDLLKVIRPNLNDTDLIDIDQKEYTALQIAKVATAEDVWQNGACREVASALLGGMNRELATFSFDGENGGKIILSAEYAERDISWHYSIDGGNTLSDPITEHFILLSKEEIATITVENDIKIYIDGISKETPIYTIDIREAAGIPSNIYANDWENKLIAAVPAMQWKFNEEDEWTAYKDAEPDLTGNKKVIVRMGATGVYVAGGEQEYTFTQDNQPDTRKYIPISHLSVHAYSTQSKDSGRPYYAPNAIDGNLNTLWHTDFALNVLNDTIKPYITIKLDKPRNISGLEFIQRKYPNKPTDPDNIKNARAYVSYDGESWILAGKIENCNTYGNLYALTFEGSVYGQYVKFEVDTTSMFASAAMINLYEDTTVTTVANFSFDGENAGKIMLLDEFKGQNWEYSLDSGATWKKGTGDSHSLTQAEIEQINVNDKIKIRFNGNEKEYKIVILKQTVPTITAYLNDLENRLIGISDTDTLEWKTEEDTKWTAYSEKEAVVPGNTKLLIRKKATGISIASDPVEYVFTEDDQPDTEKYVGIEHLSIEDFSSTTEGRGEPATNAIDGNPNTMWHTNRTTTTMNDPRWIIIKLDEPKYISKIQYVRKAEYLYGILKDGIISTSMDGQNWEQAAVIKDLYNPTNANELKNSENRKDIPLEKIKKAQYVKIELTKSCDYVNGSKDGVPYEYFFSAAMINLFEDKTRVIKSEIQYSTTELTNKDVTATITFNKENVTVEGGDTHTFTENGEYTFTFVDEEGHRGTETAKVDWIDKKVPIGTIAYSTTYPINEDVTATIEFDEENVTITNNEGNNTYTFSENGTFTFEFVDKAGNAGTAIATVTWIDTTLPVETITYSTTNPTNGEVIATITFDKENVTVEGGNTHTFTENGTHKFEFTGPAGNKGIAVAKVDWIDKEAPTAEIKYSTLEPTNEKVVATLANASEEITITNNNGSATYTFTENGEFTFEFVDKAGNKGTAKATVDCIDKKIPVATITYSTRFLTNQDVIATITFDKENVTVIGGNTHTFTENGEFTFQFVDRAGNKGIAVANVSWIDKIAPTAEITYSTTELTRKDVVATLTNASEKIVIINNNENATYTFTKNGTFTFEFIDEAGNKGTAKATVDWIEKDVPTAEITYSTTELTNKDVIATITFDKGNVAVTGGNTHTFTENGEFTFEFVDEEGNKGTAKAKVDWIDKIAPTATIEYSTTNLTNKDVVATLTNTSEEITITNNQGSATYTFTENGEFTFEFVDKAGNKGRTMAKVNCIDKKIPVATITYNIKSLTNQDVIASITFDKENVTVIGGNTHTFIENGEFTFEFIDEAGNKGKATANVNWIDKIAPTAQVTYSTTEPTNGDVVATIKFSKDVEILNEDITLEKMPDGSYTYTFTTNKDITIEFVDKLGNTGSVKVNISWILDENELYFITNAYQKEANYINGVTEQTTLKTFKQNITTNQDLIITDKNGKVVLDEEILATGMTIKEGTTGKQYTIIVKGDIDGDGEITANDLAKTQLHLINKVKLEEASLKAAELDKDNEITAGDLARIKLRLIGIIKFLSL